MNGRAQVIGQVFVFIIAAIVFVLILGYGYKAIVNFMERGEEVQMIDFKNELSSAITIIKRDYGSVQRVDLRVPSRTEEVCFVTTDPADVRAPGWEEELKKDRPLIYSAWVTGKENVFLIPKQPAPLRIDDLVVEPETTGYLCMPVVNNKVSIRVEGTGNRAKIGRWPQANEQTGN
ncbi:MAG: hypothetical protein QXT19_00845 [Candidatus Woesearchaeota archaeon]